MTKPIYISATALTAVLLIVGCGGDSTLSRAEFLKETDAICWKYHRENFKDFTAYVVTNGENLSQSLPSQEVLGDAAVNATVPAMRQIVKKMEALAAPEDEEERVEKFVAAVEDANKTIEADPSNKKAATGALYFPANRLARDYDFGRCAKLP